jgi:hypothetical protein
MQTCLVYGEVEQNSRAVVRRYQELYPNRGLASRGVFVDVHRRLCESGQVQQSTCDLGRNPNQNAVQRDEHILHLIDENRNLSVGTSNKSNI